MKNNKLSRRNFLGLFGCAILCPGLSQKIFHGPPVAYTMIDENNFTDLKGLAPWRTVTDGSFHLFIDGQTTNVSKLDFSNVTLTDPNTWPLVSIGTGTTVKLKRKRK